MTDKVRSRIYSIKQLLKQHKDVQRKHVFFLIDEIEETKRALLVSQKHNENLRKTIEDKAIKQMLITDALKKIKHEVLGKVIAEALKDLDDAT